MTQGFFNIANPVFKGAQEHVVVKMCNTFFTARTGEIAAHRQREGKEYLTVLADEEIVFFFISFAPLELVQNQLHVLTYRIIDMIGAQLPEVGQPARFIVFYTVILGKAFFIESI